MSKVRVLSDILDANNDLDIARLKSSGVTAGSYGSAANVPVITIDAYGRITAAANTAVAGVSGVAYDTATGIYTISTSAGTSYPKDLGIGTADSPSFTGLTVTNTITGNIDTSDKWKTARTLALTGAVTGSQSIDGSGNVSITTTATADPTLTLTGDATGSATFTNLGNASLAVTVADDSHNHVIANVDGLQGALDAKAPLASPTFTGTPSAPTASLATNTTQLATTAFVRGEVTALINGAPSTMDTLKELADAVAAAEESGDINTLNTLVGTKLSLSGGAMTGNVSFTDNSQLKLGSGDDLLIYHDGSNSIIKDTGTGNLKIEATDLRIGDASVLNKAWINCFSDAEVRMYYNNSQKFETTNTGINVTGKVVCDTLGLNDNEKIELGTHGDLLIYHDGSNSYISEVGTGNLDITSNGANVSIQGIAGENSIIATANSTVELYYDNSKKFETTSEGITVTGGITLTGGLTGDTLGWDTSDYIQHSNNANIGFVVNGNEEMRIEADGDLHADGDVIAYSTTISDERLKTDVSTVENALDKVKQIRGVEFTRIHDGERGAGVIAQELEIVLPQAVKEKELPLQMGDGIKYKVVEYDALHALLIESIKELSARVEELESK